MLSSTRYGRTLYRVGTVTLLLTLRARSLLTTPAAAARTRRRSGPMGGDRRPACAPAGDWSCLDPESLVAAPCLVEQALCTASDRGPRRARDRAYASAVLEAWQAQEREALARCSDDNHSAPQAEFRPVAYRDEEDGTTLHGYMVRRRRRATESDRGSSPTPVVLFFHTAAGPHDVFLLWKAASLVLVPSLAALGCWVFVADLLGDDTGWAWDSNDRSRYEEVRRHLLREDPGVGGDDDDGCRTIADPASICRPGLRRRIRAAVDCIRALGSDDDDDGGGGTDAAPLGAFGWCLGGQAILELGRMQLPQMKALVTFHGVFDGATMPPSPAASDDDAEEPPSLTRSDMAEVLLCHGVQDPFVSNEQIAAAILTFQTLQHRLSLLQLSAKHGFTNPAQAYNENPAFGYSEEAAEKSWRQALAMLQRTLSKYSTGVGDVSS